MNSEIIMENIKLQILVMQSLLTLPLNVKFPIIICPTLKLSHFMVYYKYNVNLETIMSTKALRPDSKGRISLGSLAKGVSSYAVHQEKNGTIVLEPFVEIPAKEKWLFDNKTAFKQVKTGLKQAKAGKLVKRGSFAKYADDEIE